MGKEWRNEKYGMAWVATGEKRKKTQNIGGQNGVLGLFAPARIN